MHLPSSLITLFIALRPLRFTPFEGIILTAR
jgi:hypothetical protein